MVVIECGAIGVFEIIIVAEASVQFLGQLIARAEVDAVAIVFVTDGVEVAGGALIAHFVNKPEVKANIAHHTPLGGQTGAPKIEQVGCCPRLNIASEIEGITEFFVEDVGGVESEVIAIEIGGRGEQGIIESVEDITAAGLESEVIGGLPLSVSACAVTDIVVEEFVDVERWTPAEFESDEEGRMQAHAAASQEHVGVAVLLFKTVGKRNDLVVVVAKMGDDIFEVPGDQETGGVVEGAVLSGAAEFAGSARVILEREAIVDIEQELADHEVEGEFGSWLDDQAVVFIVLHVFLITDAERELEGIVLGNGIDRVRIQHGPEDEVIFGRAGVAAGVADVIGPFGFERCGEKRAELTPLDGMGGVLELALKSRGGVIGALVVSQGLLSCGKGGERSEQPEGTNDSAGMS